ncbi:20476_t:CDS:2, partial [Dentiscutata erythropus]
NQDLTELYKHYNTNDDSDEIVDDDEFFIESQTDDSVTEQTDDSFESDCFTQQEIALFRQIYQTNLIQNFIECEEKKIK